ncbi:trifunctional serine/threonine-protein kinase/ATP-binding protein/sensor histidine kinase [Pseudomonas indica]|uniref:histidine kinase n=1 Tax=Pseudomonas indica TaxID=137658 RepID=A0A1G9BX34_9PSED|nr:AAA family ATPase [Pseudomonas indica]SDK44038.1 Predicted ATPase [Pseudomonas indica]
MATQTDTPPESPDGTPRFDESWLDRLRWSEIDRSGELSRWLVLDTQSGRHWLVVRTSPHASLWELARLDREYAHGPSLDAAWAVMPAARLNTSDGPLLVLDDDGGRPLSSLVGAPLSVERFLRLGIASAAALDQLHRSGILHRDIRPENLILGCDGSVRLTGFAFATAADASTDSALPLADSSLAYLAPEQAASPQADLYALGATFFRLLTGHPPFQADDPVQWLHQHRAMPAPAVSTRRPGLPPALDDLLACLLAKQPEKRPESAHALEAELRRCLNEWREVGSIRRSPSQAPARTAGTLVGRDRELDTLRNAIRRLEQGLGGAVLIGGEAGIGKTSLVRLLRRSQWSERCLFANGKCELSRHRLPYAALSAALASLFARLAGESPDDVRHWGKRLREAVGENGGLLVRLIPELECLTGPLPVGANPPPISEARRHLHGMLQRLLAALAGPDQPLVLFLDDVQWIDEETQTFLGELPPSGFDHLLLIAAYRDREDEPSPCLRRLIEHCRGLGARTVEIVLRPLAAAEIGDLLGSELALHSDEHALLVARLSQHGNGNPMYIAQFVAMLRESGGQGPVLDLPPLLDDIAALMNSRLERLPERTRGALAVLAILGNHTPLDILAAVGGTTVAQLLKVMHPAFDAGLVGEYREGLSFTHDAVWESTRARIDGSLQRAMCMEFALTLLDRLDADADTEEVFRVTALVMRADDTRLAPHQRSAFVELLIRAARLAMVAAAASTALDYLARADCLLAGTATADDALARSVALLIANSLILNADYRAADEHISRLLERTNEPLARAELYRLRCEIRSLRGDYDGAVRTAVDGLAALGVSFPPAPTDRQAEEAWQALQEALGARTPAIFATLPQIENPGIQATLELLATLVIPGSFIQPNLMLVATCRIATLTLGHGMSAAAVHALAWLGVASAHRFDAYALGFDYAMTAKTLAEQPRHTASKVSVLVALDQVSVWTRPLLFSLECAEAAYQAGLSQGSPSFACYANNHIVSDLLVLGAPIERMLRQIDVGLALARNLEFIDAQSILYIQARYIRRLAGQAAGTIPIPDSHTVAERVSQSSMGPLRFWWALFEGLLSFLEGAFEQAATHLDEAWSLAWSAPAHIHLIDLAMFSVLNRAALQTATGRPQDFEPPMQRLRLWANLNPRYFADRLALAEAELLRIEGRGLEALRRYEEAIDKAENCGAIHIQGLAHEMASRCHRSLGLRAGDRAHLQKAREAWRRWGAVTLAEQLEAEHPFLREGVAATTRPLPAAPQLDLLAITRACQALSREIEPTALIETLLTNAVMHAGATYTALLLSNDGVLRVEATGQANGDDIAIHLQPSSNAADAIPLRLVFQVMHTRKAQVIDSTEALRRFDDDPYLAHVEDGSLMCLPLLKQNDIIGTLYLENSLTQGAFEPTRVDVLELLAAQAAISLSTARLYTDLLAENRRRCESEGTLRRTQALLAIGQEISRYGTFVWKYPSERSFWSSRLLGELDLPVPTDDTYLKDPAVLVHADDRRRFVEYLKDATGRRESFRLEFRTLSLEGSPRYLELAGEPDGRDAFIGVVSDITERRQTEIALRAARSTLDRTSQATMLGELAASIAHEINQPLAAILSNAGASVRWLERPQPEIGEAIDSVRDILSEAQRAAAIVRAMRDLARQAPPERQTIALDRVARHVLAITRADLDDKHVSVTLKTPHSPLVHGDSIQLQQVMRNLIVNAVEAMQALPPGGRRLALEIQPVGGEWLVIVEDSGPGVPPDKLDRIFQAFYSTKATGMGMGLAICTSIVSAHGGTLGISQGRKGENLFYFTLPAHPSG